MWTGFSLTLFAFVAVSISSFADAALPPTKSAAPVRVIEFYHAALDHYFMTGNPSEIAGLDSGTIAGWRRTGYEFGSLASRSPAAALSPVCRFYGRPEAGLDSHFYSGSPDECAAVLTQFASTWLFESGDVFNVAMPDATGSCPAPTVPVYRVFNNRSDANHRYTTDIGVRQSMVLKGGISEGYGPDGVAFCADGTTGGGPSAPSPILVNVFATQLAPDMFSFSNSVTAAVGAAVLAYAWNFGDGTIEPGSAVSHAFAAPGSYSVSLTVTDERGNTASAAKVVTAAASPDRPSGSALVGSASFDARKSAPGVVRWFDFDTVSQLGSKTYGANVAQGCGTKTCPVIDTTVKASGAGALRFDIPTLSADNPAGSWSTEFSPDLSVRLGENSEFYVQWRQRFNQAFVDTKFIELWSDGTTHPQGGIKQIIVGTGNTPTRIYNSCEALEVVVTTYYQSRIPTSYNSCTGSASHGPYAGFFEPQPDGDYRLQNGTFPYCMFNTGGPACFRWVANEWLTFKIWIKLGARNNATNEFDNSEYKFWAAREGQPSQLLVHWRPGIPGYFPLTAGVPGDPQSFGKVTLLPYMTNNSATLEHPLAQTWYDELIISRQDIADPANVAPAVVLPKWRQNKPVGKWFEIPNTAGMSGVIPREWEGTVDAWGGLAAGPTTWWSAASSGHNLWWNPVIKIDLSADAPKWVLAYPSSKQSDVTKNAYYADGLPTGRHTYNRTQYINGANASDGLDRVLLFGSFAAYAIDFSTEGGYGGGPIVDGYRVAAGKWDPAGTWPDTLFHATLPSIAKDPRNDDVYYSAEYTVAKWSAKTNTWSLLQGRPSFSDTKMDAWNYYPSIVDAKRNQLIGLINANGYGAEGIKGIALQRMDLATNGLTTVRVTGALASSTQGAALVHDVDSDRYVYVTAGTVYAIDPVSAASTIIGKVQPPVVSEETRLAYFPALGGVAYLARFASNIAFMPTR